MIDIEALITHLEENTSDSFEIIRYAFDDEPQVDNEGEELPALFVYPGNETAGEDPTDNLISHVLTVTTVVQLGCRIKDIQTLQGVLRTAMIGYSAGTNYTDMQLLQGEVLSLKNGIMWWEETYFNEIVIRESYTT